MATAFTETFEGGSNGSNVTTSNTNFDVVTGTPKFTNSSPAVGSLAADFDASGSAVRVDEAVATTTYYRRFYVKCPSLPGSNLYIAVVNQGASTRADMRISASGQVVVRNYPTAAWTSTATLTAGQWARIEWKIDSSAQVQEVRIFTGAKLHGASSSPTDTSGSVTFDTGAINNIGIGIIQNTTGRIIVDDVKDDNSTWPGPATVANQAPLISYPDDDIVNGTVDSEKSITAEAVDPDGTVEAWEWTWDSVTSVSGTQPTLSDDDTDTVSFTPTEGGSYRLKVRAQDDDSAWSDYAYVTVTVPSTVGTVIQDVSGDWTVVGGSGVEVLSDDADESYYMSQPASGTPSTQEWLLSPVVQPAAYSISFNHFLTSEIAGYATISLMEGTTQRKMWNLTGDDFPTTSVSTVTLVLNSTDIEGISDWSNVRLVASWQS